MRFLDLPELARIATFLDSVDVGDYIVTGELEAYSCKLAGLDKKLSRSLDAEVAVSCSPAELSRSPVGPLAEPSARRTLVHLILTLNHAYPDYDFGALRAHHFKKEAGPAAVEDAVDAHLLGVARIWDSTPGYGGAETPFLETLWAAIDSAAGLAECDVYSYKSDGEADPFAEDGAVWSFNFFFYNRRAKRVVYFACRGLAPGGGDRGDRGGGALRGDSSDDAYNSDSADDGDAERRVVRRERYGLAGELDDLA